MPIWPGPNPKAQASGSSTAGSFPNTYTQSQGQTPLTSSVFCHVSFPKLQKEVSNSQTIWGPGEGDEKVDGPSLGYGEALLPLALCSQPGTEPGS